MNGQRSPDARPAEANSGSAALEATVAELRSQLAAANAAIARQAASHEAEVSALKADIAEAWTIVRACGTALKELPRPAKPPARGVAATQTEDVSAPRGSGGSSLHAPVGRPVAAPVAARPLDVPPPQHAAPVPLAAPLSDAKPAPAQPEAAQSLDLHRAGGSLRLEQRPAPAYEQDTPRRDDDEPVEFGAPAAAAVGSASTNAPTLPNTEAQSDTTVPRRARGGTRGLAKEADELLAAISQVRQRREGIPT